MDGLHLYLHDGRSLLRHERNLTYLQTYRVLARLDLKSPVILAGDHNADVISRTLLAVSDLIVVPDRWLRHLPLRRPAARARLAARIADDYVKTPVELRLSSKWEDWLF